MTAKQDQLFKKALSETYKYAALMHVKDYTKLSFNDVARAIKESNEFRGIRTADVQHLAESVTKHLKESVMSEIDLAISDAKADGLDNAAIARDLASKYRIGLADAEHLVAQWVADNQADTVTEATSALAQWKQKVKAAHPTATFEVRKKTDRYGSDRVEANVGDRMVGYFEKKSGRSNILEASESAIKLGDKIRTIKMGQIPGVVEKIDGDWVIFRHESGKLYRAPMSNVRLDESLSGRSSFDRAHQRFKHDELAQELKGEDQYYQKMPSRQTSKWYIRIDGRLWRKNGQPVEFNGRNHATAAAATIQKRSPGKIVTLTTTPTDVEKHQLFKEDVGDAAAAYINKIAYSKVHPNNIGRFRREATGFLENNRGASVGILKAGLMALAHVFAKANLTETDDDSEYRTGLDAAQEIPRRGRSPAAGSIIDSRAYNQLIDMVPDSVKRRYGIDAVARATERAVGGRPDGATVRDVIQWLKHDEEARGEAEDWHELQRLPRNRW